MTLPEECNFLKSYDQICDAEAENGPFHVRVRHPGSHNREALDEVVIVPKILPGQKHEKRADNQPVHDMNPIVDGLKDIHDSDYSRT